MKKVCVITGARSEYGLLRWVIDGIDEDSELQLQLVVTGGHLSPEQGLTYQAIETDGYHIDEKVEMLLSSETVVGISKSMGVCALGMADVFGRLQPDMVVVLGDRYELLPVVSTALVMRIPIAHISGGDVTEGAIDDEIRNAVTMMATLHFPGTEESAARIKAMRQSTNNIFVTGETNLDNFRRLPLLSREQLAESLGLNPQKEWILGTYHSETTLSVEENLKRVKNLLSALETECSDCEILFTKANSDIGGNLINERLQQQAEAADNFHFVSSLGQQRYISMLYQVKMMVGNSSSGIYETPLVKLPVLNIGDRQKGRLITANILCCEGSLQSMCNALKELQSEAFLQQCKTAENPYGDGHASERIVEHIKRFLDDRDTIL